MGTTVSSRVRRKDVNRGFFLFLGFSGLLHVGLIGGKVFLDQQRPPKVIINSVPVQLVKLGKKRDPALLPRKTGGALPPPADDGIALDSASKSKKRSKRDRRRREPKMSDAARRLLESATDPDLAPNDDEPEGSPDGSIYGTTTDTTNAASGYITKVSEAIHKSYKLPATIAESERRFLSAEVVLYIEADGTLSKYEYLKIHPNEAFKRALEAVLKSLKLPPPPPQLAQEYRTTGLGVRFKPRQ